MNIIQEITSKSYRFAKTMPNNPHFYSIKREWNNDENFFKACQYIRDNGKVEFYKGYPYVVLYIDNYKYWTMDRNIRDTEIINRALA